nr:MAG TPA: hypothetical protein [Caudoviricetes sp.]
MTNNQLAENSVIQLLNSVKLARDNAERADNRVDHSFYYALTIALEELQERRQATMNSEPVAWTDEQELRDVDRGGCGYLFTVNPVTPHADERRIILLYRHAQPAPVVPVGLEHLRSIVADPRLLPRRKEWIGGQQYSYVLLEEVEAIVDEACHAAMLQAQSGDDGEPTDDERIMAIEGIHNCERCGDEGWVVGEMGITRCVCSQDSNSPQSPGSEPANDDRDHQLCRRCNDGIRGGCSSCAYNVR